MAKRRWLALGTAAAVMIGSIGTYAQEVVLKQDTRVEMAVDAYSHQVDQEKEVLEALDMAYGWEFALQLGKFGTATDGSGFRMAGTSASKATSEYIYKAFESFGYEPAYYEFPIVEWHYENASMTVKGHEDLALPVVPFVNTPATPEGGLEGELVYIGNGTKEELEGVDLTGKIALIDMDVDKMLWHNNAALQARLHGAEAVVLYYTTYYGTDESGEAGFVGDWSGRRIDIPVLSIPQKYGKQLAIMTREEKVQVNLVSNVWMNEAGTGRNVLAKLEGQKYPDEYIVVNAHHDAFFTSMQDDSLPIGLMMTMAKAMAEVGYTPERSILFVSTDAEETGDIDTFYDWMMGAWRMVSDKIDEWGGKVVNAHILEMFGMKGSEELGFRAPDVMYPFAVSVTEGYQTVGTNQEHLGVDNFITTSSDEWVYSYYGIPTTRTRNEAKADEVYHTALDNEAHADFGIYEDNVNLQTMMIMRLAEAPLLPYDLATIGERYLGKLDGEVLASRGINENLEKAAKAFIKEADKLYEEAIHIKKLYTAAEKAGKDLKAIEQMLEDYNAKMRAVSEIVIRGTQYVGLDQVLTQTEYYQNLPMAYEEAIAYLKDGDAAGMLEHFDTDSDDMGQYAQGYMAYMEYPVWINAYRECFEPESKALKRNWTDGILLKYYDIYHVMESIQQKVEDPSATFTYEIEALATVLNDVQRRLTLACEEDEVMWQEAKGALPMEESQALLKALK
ncbi:MAG: M28 family peptidase [Cellulosilyticaceae bacterium]